jgi:hypothetical protein
MVGLFDQIDGDSGHHHSEPKPKEFVISYFSIPGLQVGQLCGLKVKEVILLTNERLLEFNRALTRGQSTVACLKEPTEVPGVICPNYLWSQER